MKATRILGLEKTLLSIQQMGIESLVDLLEQKVSDLLDKLDFFVCTVRQMRPDCVDSRTIRNLGKETTAHGPQQQSVRAPELSA